MPTPDVANAYIFQLFAFGALSVLELQPAFHALKLVVASVGACGYLVLITAKERD